MYSAPRLSPWICGDSMFFDEFSSLLDELVTRSEPLIVAGDFNIRLDRPDDHHSTQLLDALSAHCMQCHVNSPTHDRGGILDIVATQADLTAPLVSLLEVGISDHRLLRWVSQLERPPPSTTRRRIVRGVMSTWTSSRSPCISRRYVPTPPMAMTTSTFSLTSTPARSRS